jgi:hypothetical protein
MKRALARHPAGALKEASLSAPTPSLDLAQRAPQRLRRPSDRRGDVGSGHHRLDPSLDPGRRRPEHSADLGIVGHAAVAAGKVPRDRLASNPSHSPGA